MKSGGLDKSPFPWTACAKGSSGSPPRRNGRASLDPGSHLIVNSFENGQKVCEKPQHTTLLLYFYTFGFYTFILMAFILFQMTWLLLLLFIF